eukprot:GHVU01202889.1.p2 GENE.GHVU01202889.1~~GHVU01202889.1.p2  ORF type:complete len:200 (+),score=19.12 GHVU01202889.1:184-783(+)
MTGQGGFDSRGRIGLRRRDRRGDGGQLDLRSGHPEKQIICYLHKMMRKNQQRKSSITGVVYDSNMRPAGLATFAAAGPDLTGFSSYQGTTEDFEAPGWVTGNRTEKKRERRRSSAALRKSFIEAALALLQEPEFGLAWTRVDGKRRASWSNRHVGHLPSAHVEKRRPIVFPRSGGARQTPAWMLAVWEMEGSDEDEDEE